MVRKLPQVTVLGRRCDNVALADAGVNEKRRRMCCFCLQKIKPSSLKVHLAGCVAAARITDISNHEEHGSFGKACDGETLTLCNMVYGGVSDALRMQLLEFSAFVRATYNDGDYTLEPGHTGQLLGIGWNHRAGCFYGPPNVINTVGQRAQASA